MQSRWKSRPLPNWASHCLRKARWHLVLALVLLLMQQVGLRHSLAHAIQDESAPAHAVCVACLAHHGHDLGTAHVLPTLALVELVHVLVADPAQPQLGHSVQAGYQPRAPPVFSV